VVGGEAVGGAASYLLGQSDGCGQGPVEVGPRSARTCCGAYGWGIL